MHRCCGGVHSAATSGEDGIEITCEEEPSSPDLVQALVATDKRLIEVLGSTNLAARAEGTRLARDIEAGTATAPRPVEVVDDRMCRGSGSSPSGTRQPH